MLCVQGCIAPLLSHSQAIVDSGSHLVLLPVAFALITPIPLDIGLLEVSGVGALVALGVDETAAVGVMLLTRMLSIGASVAIVLVAVVVLHGELRTAFQERPSHPSARSPLTTPASDP